MTSKTPIKFPHPHHYSATQASLFPQRKKETQTAIRNNPQRPNIVLFLITSFSDSLTLFQTNLPSITLERALDALIRELAAEGLVE
jgi:hypothetical protein